MQNTNYEIIQGDTWTLDVYYEDKDGNPINISNYNIVAEVKDKQGGSILCASASMDDGVTLIDDGNYNAVRVEFSPSKTSKFNIFFFTNFSDCIGFHINHINIHFNIRSNKTIPRATRISIFRQNDFFYFIKRSFSKFKI